MNHDFPPTLSKYGKLPPTSKADILHCLKSVPMSDIEVYSLPNVDSSIIDAPAWVHMHPPRRSKEIGDYCCEEEVLSPIINSTLKHIDLVFDVYREDSLKRDVRMR